MLEIYKEEDFKREYQSLYRLIMKEINNLGIDKTKYYFVQALLYNNIIEITYALISNENYTINITIKNSEIFDITLSGD